jgi:hypothetical protein
MADDLVEIDEDGIHGKKELLEQIRAAEVRFSDYKMENVKVIPQGNGSVVAYQETLVGTEHGKPFTWHIYTHSHWERRGTFAILTELVNLYGKDRVRDSGLQAQKSNGTSTLCRCSGEPSLPSSAARKPQQTTPQAGPAITSSHSDWLAVQPARERRRLKNLNNG